MRWIRRYPMALLALALVGIICLLDTFCPHVLCGQSNYSDSIALYRVVVDEYAVEKAKTWRCEAGDVYLYFQKDSSSFPPSPGDTLLVRTRLRTPEPFNGFDYAAYLRRQGIHATGYVSAHNWKRIGETSLPNLNPKHIRHRLLNRYADLGISGDELATMGALSLGYREDIEPDIRRAFSRAGAMHILAVSGLHTGVLYGVLIFILTFGGLRRPLYEQKTKRCLLSASVIILLWCYAALTGWSPSVVRSVIMVSMIEIARMCYRRNIAFNTIASAAVFILAFRPNDLFSVSFQLSFAAVIAILTIHPLFPSIRFDKIRPAFLKTPIRYIYELLTVSIAAQIGTMPLTLYYFNQTSNWFLLTNCMVIPLASVTLALALAILTVGWIPGIGQLLAPTLNFIVKCMNRSVAFVEHLPGAVTQMSISLPMMFALYGFIVSGLLVIYKRNLLWIIPSLLCITLFCLLYATT